jgi:hypothetical protein
MLLGNINGRIATFANKNEGFDGNLFSKNRGTEGGKQKFSCREEAHSYD